MLPPLSILGLQFFGFATCYRGKLLLAHWRSKGLMALTFLNKHQAKRELRIQVVLQIISPILGFTHSLFSAVLPCWWGWDHPGYSHHLLNSSVPHLMWQPPSVSQRLGTPCRARCRHCREKEQTSSLVLFPDTCYCSDITLPRDNWSGGRESL